MGRAQGGVRIHPKVSLPKRSLARQRPRQVAKGVTPLGDKPVWLTIDKKSDWHGTVRPLPAYAGGGYVAFVSQRSQYRTSPKVHEGRGRSPETALKRAWEAATPLKKQADIRERVQWTNTRAVRDWLEATAETPYFEAGTIPVPAPEKDGEMYVWYESDHNERSRSVDPDGDTSHGHYDYTYQFLALSDSVPRNDTHEINYHYGKAPRYFDRASSTNDEGYAVVAFMDENDYYDTSHNKADILGVFDDIETARIYAEEYQALQGDRYSRRSLNSVDIFPLDHQAI